MRGAKGSLSILKGHHPAMFWDMCQTSGIEGRRIAALLEHMGIIEMYTEIVAFGFNQSRGDLPYSLSVVLPCFVRAIEAARTLLHAGVSQGVIVDRLIASF
jgi:hypothetical protein